MRSGGTTPAAVSWMPTRRPGSPRYLTSRTAVQTATWQAREQRQELEGGRTVGGVLVHRGGDTAKEVDDEE